MVKLRGSGPIVVVDDSQDSLKLTKLAFEFSEVPRELVLLNSGTELLAYLNSVSKSEREVPSIVLLDINMPPP